MMPIRGHLNVFVKILNLSEDEITLAIPLYRRAEGFYKYYLQEIQKNSKKILKDVMGENPSTHVLVSIDITRPMEVVLAELKKLISRNKKRVNYFTTAPVG